MNPSKSAQDVLRCHLCETPVPPLCCEICHIYLCKGCVVDHILDETTEHKVVSIKQTLSVLLYPPCLKHFSKKCELYCEQCTIPICVQCASTQEHRGHGFKDLLECVERRREASQTDLQEFESSILIEHKEFASCIRNQKANLGKTLQGLKTAIHEHGEKLHRQVSDVVEKFKSDIVKKHEERFEALTKTEEKNALRISEIEKCILSIKELQASRDLGRVFEFKSRNEEFRNAQLPKHNITLPTFVAYKIKADKLYELFGSLTMTSDEIGTVEQGVKSKSGKCHNWSTTQMRDLCELERDQTLMQERQVNVKCMVYIKRIFITCLPISPIGFIFISRIFLFIKCMKSYVQ